jgi:hypothetical protein
MENTELLLACQVREISKELRKQAAAVAAKSGQRHADETFDSFHGRFALAHPLTEYAKEALAELQAISKAMRD